MKSFNFIYESILNNNSSNILLDIVIPIFEKFGFERQHIYNVYIANKEDIISQLNGGFFNSVTKKEAEEYAGKLVIIDTDGYISAEELENSDLENELFNAIIATFPYVKRLEIL